MPLIGTAGHVDHGKSTLVRRLTGRDPDRWQEEKERGLTIDLGFAWTTLPSGTEVSFVDVPGHERYLKNMLAGIEAIDVALLVVAADEGWMPQTEEHLAVLDLLGVDRGIVVLTKVDLVDSELVELVELEVSEQIDGTGLQDAAVVAVSAVEGEGIEGLISALDDLVGSPALGVVDRPRLWIDRSFPIPGAGTVVTGSLLDGSVSVEETVEVYPKGVKARIRGIQSHETQLTDVGPGRRVALNLSGVEHSEIDRGDMVGRPGQWDLTNRFSASVVAARYVDEVGTKGSYTIHLGSSAQRVTMTGRSEKSAVLQLTTPISVAAGDRFVLRDTGRKLVVAGGQVVDVAPSGTRSALEFADGLTVDVSPNELAAALLAIRGTYDVERLANQTAGGLVGDALTVGDVAIDARFVSVLIDKAVHEVADTHDKYPLRTGLPLATLAERLGTDVDTAASIVDRSELVRHGPDIAQLDFEPQVSSEQDNIWREAKTRLSESLAVPADVDLGLPPELLAFYLRRDDLIRVSDLLVYLPEQIEKLREAAAGLAHEFTVAEYRDATQLSRKYAVPILEWMDKEGLTVRRGDRRRFR